MTEHNRYGAICAEIYDLDKPYFAMPDTQFYLDLLASAAGPVLEPGCGSGRTMIPLMEAGHDVMGFDSSAAMLTRLHARARERGLHPKTQQARFDNFTMETRFAAIVIPAGTFTLIDRFGPALAALQRFHEHLAPAGLLALDVMTLNYLRERPDDIRSWTNPEGDVLRLEGRRVETDFVEQRLRTDYRYERWRNGSLIASELDQMAQRAWGVAEFTFALEAAGFGDVEICAGYRRTRAPRASDVTLTYMARKR